MAGYFSKTDFTPSTSNTYTVSFWVKINNFAPTSSNVPYLWSISNSSTSGLFFQADTTPYNITFFRANGSTRYSPTNYMRDVNAWYHIHLKVSSGTGTLYYNGESVKTSITVDAQNYNGGGAGHYIHTYGSGLTDYDNLECVMSHFHFVDGTAYDPSAFAETDSTTGEWKIKTAPSVTYGTNGYFILKDGNTGTDHSGNGNNFTLTGTCTKTEDCPSNVFCTLNSLGYAASANYTLANGNTSKTTTGTTNAWRTAYGTMGASSGKYYWEVKITGDESGDPGNMFYGIVSAEQMNNTSNNSYFTAQANGYGYHGKTGNVMNNTTGAGNSYGASITTNDILGVAVDLDNNKIYFAKNGTWQNSGNPASGSTGTGSAFTLASGITYLPAFAQYYGAEQYAINMGNGYFQSTAVSSAGTNASGNGIFEYDVPSGYTALSTKGLNL